MANNIKLVVFPVKDVAAAKEFYNTFLGVEPYADSPYYVGYKAGDVEIGLDPNGSAVITYIDVDNIAASLQALQDEGAKVVKESTDVGGGLLVAQVEIQGNVMGLRQPVK
jgi:predicted enzyme related to lactoylglutathione lyase